MNTTPKRVFAVKKQGSISKVYRAWEDYKEGDTVVGPIIGYHLDKYGKYSPVLSVVHAEFKDEKSAAAVLGKNLVLNNCGSLQNCFAELDINLNDKASRDAAMGHGIQAEYAGEGVVKNGKFAGQDCHIVTANIVDLGDEEEPTTTTKAASDDDL